MIGSTAVQSLTDLFAEFMDSAVKDDDQLASGAPTGRIERILPQRSRSSETMQLLLWFWLSSSHGVGVAEGWGK